MAALDDVRRRFEHAGAQNIGDGGQACLIIVQTIRIPHREFSDLSFRLAAATFRKPPSSNGRKLDIGRSTMRSP